MKKAIVHLKSVSPYSPSRYHNTDKLEKESHDDYERRTWMHKAHYDHKTREIFIPAMSFANSIKDAAQYSSIKVKGKGNATWTKHFDAGVMVVNPLPLPVTIDNVEHEWLYLNADGKRNSGTRVMRCFPLIREWEGTIEYIIVDDAIDQEIFTEVLTTAGQLIGVGRFRPRNRGYYGRYQIIDLKWEDYRV